MIDNCILQLSLVDEANGLSTIPGKYEGIKVIMDVQYARYMYINF